MLWTLPQIYTWSSRTLFSYRGTNYILYERKLRMKLNLAPSSIDLSIGSFSSIRTSSRASNCGVPQFLLARCRLHLSSIAILLVTIQIRWLQIMVWLAMRVSMTKVEFLAGRALWLRANLWHLIQQHHWHVQNGLRLDGGKLKNQLHDKQYWPHLMEAIPTGNMLRSRESATGG